MGVQITLVALFCGLLFGTVQAKLSMLEVTHEWNPNFGWEVVCSWKLLANDSLQSIRLYKTEQQFLIYRPQTDGVKRTVLIRLPTIELLVDCFETDTNGVTGKCAMRLEILEPVKETLSYTCEVSGEGPMFRTDSKTINIEAFVPPTDAVVEMISEKEQTTGRVNLNCTSSGLPAPALMWNIGDQKIPADFTGGSWNYTSKLYHVWASLSYTPNGISDAVCTPETVSGGQVVRGASMQYNAAEVISGATPINACLLLILALTR